MEGVFGMDSSRPYVSLNIVNCKIVEHCFDGIFGVKGYNPEPSDHQWIGVQFTDRTKLFDADGKEVNIEEYFKDVKDGLWVWINNTKEDDGRFWKILYPTTRVFYVLDGEKFTDRHEVSLKDADAMLDPEKEYVAILNIRLRERRWHKDESDKYVVYATRIFIKEL